MKNLSGNFYTIICRCLVFSCFFSTIAFAQSFPLSENSWSNPEFVARYMGSYGIDGALSPEVTEAESLIMQDLLPFVEDDVESGIFFLVPKINGESSAALDFMLGQLYLENENSEEAIAAYEAAIRKFPTFLRAYKNIALAYMQNGDCIGAKPHLNKVLEMGQGDGLTFGFLGYCNLQDENYASALSAYSMARLFQPDNRNWKIGYAQSSMEAEKYQDAIVILDELIKSETVNENYLMLQANSYLAIDEQERAIANLEILRRSNKATGVSLLLLGDLYIKNDIPSLAIKSYLAALDVQQLPNFERASRALDYFAREQRWGDAESYLSKLKNVYAEKLTENVDRISLMVMEAQIAQGNENFSEAARLLNDVVEQDPLNGKALLLLAQNHKNSGAYERAEFYFDRAAQIDEYAFEALTDNARMAVEFRRFARALNLLNKANSIRSSSTLDDNIRILENAVKAQGV